MKATDVTTQRNANAATKNIAQKIYKLAEEAAYNERSSGRQAVTGDAIFDAAAKIMEKIQRQVVENVEKYHMGKEGE